MAIELDSTLPPQHWQHLSRATLANPAIRLRPFHPGQDDRGVYEAHEAAFAGSFGYTPTPFEVWATRQIAHPGFDPTLCLVAVQGKSLVGFLNGWPRGSHIWIAPMAVRPEARRQGIALGLMYAGYAAFAAQGFFSVGLSVDLHSPTGASRVYERAGMRLAPHEVPARPLRDSHRRYAHTPG